MPKVIRELINNGRYVRIFKKNENILYSLEDVFNLFGDYRKNRNIDDIEIYIPFKEDGDRTEMVDKNGLFEILLNRIQPDSDSDEKEVFINHLHKFRTWVENIPEGIVQEEPKMSTITN